MSNGDPSTFLRTIHVEESCLDHWYTKEILARASLPVHVVPDRGRPQIASHPYPKNLAVGKQHLFLCRNRGKFLKPCPATREYCCCDYHVLNIGANCPMDCVYCILQAYLNNPWLSFYTNIEELFAELDKTATRGLLRIGTGEFTDSMALDRITGLSRLLVEDFARRPEMVLELKTKAATIDHLAGIDHRGGTIVAWSLNSPPVMEKEELRTASLDQRLAAAAQCAEMGYLLAFHFDPIVYHAGWQQGYAFTIRELFNRVPADRIVWISMGALRYLPSLRDIATDRFPGSSMFHEEFIGGLDGKMRYFRTLRREMYRHIGGLLRKHAHPDTCVYFCMESEELWREVMGYIPADHGGLPRMLDRAAARFCGIALSDDK